MALDSGLQRRDFLFGMSASCLGFYVPLPAAPQNSGERMPYQWQLLTNALPPALDYQDGVGGISHNGKMYAMGGWQQGGARFNSVCYSTDGITWTQSTRPASWSPRHVFPVVSHNGRIYVLGGDSNSGSYQPDVHSWSGNESDPWVVETANAPWGNRIGHLGFSYGGYLWVGFGQTITPLTQPPTQFFTDLWRSVDGKTWELFEAKAVSGWRPFSQAVVLDDEVFFIGGGTYDTTDFPAREYKNDVFAMGPDFSIRLISHGKNSPLTRMMYHSIAVLDGKIFVMAGWANADQKRVFMSPDKCVTWTELPLPPWQARHAAMLISHNDALYFGTGMSVTDMWKLSDVVPPPASKLRLGAPVDGVTGLPAVYTVLDKTTSLVPGIPVVGIGMSCARSHSMIPKIARQLSANTFDIVWSGPSVTHPGGGHASFAIPQFTPPADGYTYRVGFALEYLGGADSYAFGGAGRFMKLGNISGNGQVFSAPTDGGLSMSWTEA